MRIGVLHPGEMGVSIAQALHDSGHDVCWVSAGRSAQTQSRGQPFNAYASLSALLASADGIVAVCPPHSALEMAQEVQRSGFQGVYVDANAVAPNTAAAIGQIIGASYVDGGIIGPPAHKPGTTRLYLSGAGAGEVANWFSAGVLDVVPLTGQPTAASSLKMAYAAYTKGSSALLLAVNALAEAAGVRDALVTEWQISQPGLDQRSHKTAAGTSPKAWRFAGEMQEIAATFEAVGLPGDIHRGAAELYQRMAAFKDLPPAELDTVLQHLLKRA